MTGGAQWYVIGPILFAIFINDLPNMIHSTVHIFSDDTKVYRKSSSENDWTELQADLQRLVEWSEKWQLQFNANRCLAYKIGDIELQSTKVEQDFGVYVDEALTFHKHTSFAVNNSSRMLWLIKKTWQKLLSGGGNDISENGGLLKIVQPLVQQLKF